MFKMVSVVLLFYLYGALGFNIDTENVVQFNGIKGSYFGYTSTLLRNAEGPWAVVGAVKANFSDDNIVQSPGNIYKCKIDFMTTDQSNCLPINPRPDYVCRWPDDYNVSGYEEDRELLGASMAKIGDDLVTCAPLWKNMLPDGSSHRYAHPKGTCFTIKQDLTTATSKAIPNRTLRRIISDDKNDFTYEMAQIGFSISDKPYNDQLNVLLGAPGFFDHKGGFLQYDASLPDNFFDFYTPAMFESDDQRKALKRGSQMGYSITTGRVSHFCNDVIVLGAPHYSSAVGIVGAVFVICAQRNDSENNVITVKKQFNGQKYGCAFGAAIVFDDFNNDGLDDLLVGSPLYFDNAIDSGAVYIYYGDQNASILLRESRQILKGTLEYGRFGSALQMIGDVNKDGYKDVAVGAPYEDNLRGGVYIYHGSERELKFTQKIQAKEIDSGLRSFGWYIGTSFDIDENGYADFVVGSYLSDKVSILRARPIVKLVSSVTISPNVIPLNSSGLECRDALFRPCVTIRLCFSYTGNNVPNNITVTYNLTSDSHKIADGKQSRTVLSSTTQHFKSHVIRKKCIQVSKGSETCLRYFAIVQNANYDFFSSLEEPLTVEAKYGLSINAVPGEVKPIVNNVPSKVVNAANFTTGCFGTCHPDLMIEATLSPTQVILGQTSEIVVHVTLINSGDLSHFTRITIANSNNTKYIGLFRLQNEPTELVLCNDVMDTNNVSRVRCDLRKSLFQQQQAIVKVRFEVSRLLLMGEMMNLGTFNQNIQFNVTAETTSPDRNPSDNFRRLGMVVKFHSKLQMLGISTPDQLTVSEKADKILNFVHTYDITNTGPSHLYNGSIQVCLAILSDTGETMLKRDNIQVVAASPKITWKLIKCPGFITYLQEEAVSTTTKKMSVFSSTTLPPRFGMNLNKRRRYTSHLKTQKLEAGNKLKEISCITTEESKRAVIEIQIDQMKKGEIISFDVLVNITEKALNFSNVSGIILKSIGRVNMKNKNRYMITSLNGTFQVSGIILKSIGRVNMKNKNRYMITSLNGTFQVPIEIYPKEPTVHVDVLEPEKVDIWIIILGGCVGGLLPLLVVVLIFWKNGSVTCSRSAMMALGVCNRPWRCLGVDSSNGGKKNWSDNGKSKVDLTPSERVHGLVLPKAQSINLWINAFDI